MIIAAYSQFACRACTYIALAAVARFIDVAVLVHTLVHTHVSSEESTWGGDRAQCRLWVLTQHFVSMYGDISSI